MYRIGIDLEEPILHLGLQMRIKKFFTRRQSLPTFRAAQKAWQMPLRTW